MAKMRITGHRRDPRHVVVFEPRQTPEQDEVVIDEFDLRGGAEVEREYHSATAGYRLEPIPSDRDPEFVDDGGEEGPTDPNYVPPAQEGTITASAQAELDAGQKAQQLHEERENDALKVTETVRKPRSRAKAAE
jgi:hypothetical protein